MSNNTSNELPANLRNYNSGHRELSVLRSSVTNLYFVKGACFTGTREQATPCTSEQVAFVRYCFLNVVVEDATPENEAGQLAALRRLVGIVYGALTKPQQLVARALANRVSYLVTGQPGAFAGAGRTQANTARKLVQRDVLTPDGYVTEFGRFFFANLPTR